MENRMTLSLLLALSVLVAVIMPSTAQGQQPLRFSSSSGVITLAEGQTLRVTAAACVIGCVEELMEFRFAWKQYSDANCSGSPQVCRHTVVSQGVTPRETLSPDGALSFEMQGPGPVNVSVRSSSRNARILGIVFDTSTQRINAICTFIPD